MTVRSPEPAPAPAYPARAAAVAALPLDDDLVLYAPGGGHAYILNQTAARVWSLCDGTQSAEAIAEAIATEYDVEYDRALEDVRTLFAQFRRAGLLE